MDYHGLSKHISVARNQMLGCFHSHLLLRAAAVNRQCALGRSTKKNDNYNPHLARSAAQLFLDLETVRYNLG